MTARLGQVKEIIQIDIPRPRSLSLIGDPKFGGYTERIRALFDETRRRKPADHRAAAEDCNEALVHRGFYSVASLIAALVIWQVVARVLKLSAYYIPAPT